MFDIGFLELLVIGVVALLVIGPERLPGLARKAGYWAGRLQRWLGKVRTDVEKELNAEELRQAIERHADLQEIQEIVRRGQKQVSEISQPDYLVRATPDEDRAATDDDGGTGDVATTAADDTGSAPGGDTTTTPAKAKDSGTAP
ncbi:MAG TPA: twin-arginine translocase subunit TatB [Gammaproteobacteria bacterium]|nr:twin-arginine translocase subunit TatB [Gammaproteobacteria bacterium]